MFQLKNGQRRQGNDRMLPILVVFLMIVSGCTPIWNAINKEVNISITVDGNIQTISVPYGTTVLMALELNGTDLREPDEVDPPGNSIIKEPIQIKVKRVWEEIFTEEITIPYDRQIFTNETQSEDHENILQTGTYGLIESTYRLRFEEGKEISRTIVRTELIKGPEPEIIMLGVKNPIKPLPVKGIIAYLCDGNAWIIEENTANRRIVVSSGDLDGIVFTLSPDRQWLLFTRKLEETSADDINSLWAVNIYKQDGKLISLNAANIVHFADWVPNTRWKVTYSTVEQQSAEPGWQAKNDLHSVTLDAEGNISSTSLIVPQNSGGSRGGWGTDFAWSSDGKRLAYAQPDSIGLVNISDGNLMPILPVSPYQNLDNRVWLPRINWSSDHRVLYTVNHTISKEFGSDNEISNFDIMALVPETNLNITLVQQSGMFSYPTAYPYESGKWNLIAYLQVTDTEKRNLHQYQLAIMDRDGSNREIIFPDREGFGLEPQEFVWEPGSQNGIFGLGVIYQSDLWIIRPQSGSYQQVTDKNAIVRIDWK